MERGLGVTKPAYAFAAEIGIDPMYLSRYMRGLSYRHDRGRDGEIHPRHLIKICEALGVRPYEVVGWDEDEWWDNAFEQRLRPEVRRNGALSVGESAQVPLGQASRDR